MSEQLSVSLEGLVEATREQRNQAMDQAAAFKAVAADLQAKLDQANAEIKRLTGAPVTPGQVESETQR